MNGIKQKIKTGPHLGDPAISLLSLFTAALHSALLPSLPAYGQY